MNPVIIGKIVSTAACALVACTGAYLAYREGKRAGKQEGFNVSKRFARQYPRVSAIIISADVADSLLELDRRTPPDGTRIVAECERALSKAIEDRNTELEARIRKAIVIASE